MADVNQAQPKLKFSVAGESYIDLDKLEKRTNEFRRKLEEATKFHKNFMPVEISLVERNRIADDLFGGEDFEIRTYSNTISATGNGDTELTGEGYAAIEVENNLTNFPTATTGTRTNAVAFKTADPLAESATINSLGVFNTDGDFLVRCRNRVGKRFDGGRVLSGRRDVRCRVSLRL